MEILIPGLILVALMVYISTRIKRSAANAYEKETVETAEFSITKPEGFIILDSSDPNVIFAAHSKDYGTGDADRFRRVSAELRRHEDRSIDEVKSLARDNVELIGEQHLGGGTTVIETRRSIDGIEFEHEYWISQKDETIYELRITALAETKEDDLKNIDELLASFELK